MLRIEDKGIAAKRHKEHSAAKPQPNFHHEEHEVLKKSCLLLFLRAVRPSW
jgi:hypothetical protein